MLRSNPRPPFHLRFFLLAGNLWGGRAGVGTCTPLPAAVPWIRGSEIMPPRSKAPSGGRRAASGVGWRSPRGSTAGGGANQPPHQVPGPPVSPPADSEEPVFYEHTFGHFHPVCFCPQGNHVNFPGRPPPARIAALASYRRKNPGWMPDRHQVERLLTGIHAEEGVDLVVVERPDRDRRKTP